MKVGVCGFKVVCELLWVYWIPAFKDYYVPYICGKPEWAKRFFVADCS